MKKKLFFFILLIIIGFSVYFFAFTPMLDNEDQSNFKDNQDETQTENKEEQSNDPQSTEPEGEPEIIEKETIAEQVRAVIVDSIKNTFNYEEVNIVGIGDSLTEGIGDQTNREGYMGVLERTINRDDKVAHFFNYGKKGNKAAQLLKRLDEPEINESIQDANIILITIGANDIMQVLKENFTHLKYEQFTAARKNYEENLQQILKKVHDNNEDAHVYLLGVYNPFGKYFEDIDELNHIVDDWNESGKSVTSQYDYMTFIPINDLFADQEEQLLSDDHFHPNSLGYQRMGDRVLDYFKDRWLP